MLVPSVPYGDAAVEMGMAYGNGVFVTARDGTEVMRAGRGGGNPPSKESELHFRRVLDPIDEAGRGDGGLALERRLCGDVILNFP